MARLLELKEGEYQLTELLEQKETLESQWGHLTYLEWCKLEAERINLARGASGAWVYQNGGLFCCIVARSRA